MPKPSRIGWSLIGGCAVGLPIGWLMGYLALLPFFLGLFFFALLGLVVGAVMFRFGRPAAPAPRPALWLIGNAVAIVVCGAGLVGEYYGLVGYRVFGHEVEGDAYQAVRESFRYRSFTQDELARLRGETRRHTLAQLEADYPPGGFVGYLRWAASRGTMECPRIFDDTTHTILLRHRRVTWLIRVALSLGLLSFSIMSQVLGLAGPLPGGGGLDE